MGMFELIKEFRSKTEGKDTPPSMRLLYYELLFEFNDSFWKTDLAYSERELSILTGMSKTAINKAINLLSDYGFIKVNRSHGRRTKFTLKSDHVPTISRPLNDLEKATERPSELVSYTHARAEDLKTPRPKDTADNNNNAGTRGGSNGGESETAAANIKVAQKRMVKVSDGVRHRWIQATFTNPTELDEEGLAALEKEFGSEKVFFAIGKANQYKKQPTINLALVEAILRNGGKSKGDAGRGKSNTADDDINARYYNLR